MTSEDFQAMIPSHFLSGGKSYEVKKIMPATTETIQGEQGGSAVSITVRKGTPDMPMMPPAPTDLGVVTETITKSTLTETVMTRVTDNRLSEPLISEVRQILLSSRVKKVKKPNQEKTRKILIDFSLTH
jgi:protein scribble